MVDEQQQDHPAALSMALELGEQTSLLSSLLAELRSGVIDVAVSDEQHRELTLEQFPVAGATRVVAHRTGQGRDSLAVPTAGVKALDPNTARIGGTIVNSGANAMIVYLTGSGVATPGVPAIWLAGSGGAWDFRLGNVLWCGSVTLVAQTGATTATIAEV